MNNPFQITFTLKQHTPIIHFQHFLKGATLRSTELKSALDKFIIQEKTGCWSSEPKERLQAAINREDLKKWLKHADKPQQPAFDYDVELIFNEHNQPPIKTNDLRNKYNFFGNQMGEPQCKEKAMYKYGIFTNQPIVLIIKSVHEDLLKKIDELVGKFFLLKNFGTRQSKGFGCFYPIEKYDYLKTQEELPYYFDVDESQLHNINVFGVIHLFYNTLRSGINKPNRDKTDSDFYFKSMMWAYAKSKNEQWDKKSIKNTYKALAFSSEDSKWKSKSVDYMKSKEVFPLGYFDSKSDEVQRHLWRDLLGLSSDEKWGVKKIIDDNSKFTRFKSPIIFKPLLVGENQYRVLWGVPKDFALQFKTGANMNTDSEILGKVFRIKFNNDDRLKLTYPNAFDYSDYLTFVINTYNANPEWIEKRFHSKPEFKIIDAIYKHLKTQL